jgi:hypothetical protein
MAMAAEAEPQFEERGFFEFHLYNLQRRTTIADRETKQISLFQPATISGVEKKFTFDAQRSGPKVVVTLEFDNKSSSGLGIALPAGKVRVYKKDSDGSQEFVGEDRIDHTPRNEEVKLTVGRAFPAASRKTPTRSRSETGRTSRSRSRSSSTFTATGRSPSSRTITKRRMRSRWSFRSACRPTVPSR